ncbi:MAG: redoxin domain-containing protein [Nitrospirae bacterium]|nr:redoxin domain-containing protein [Nitrospirota bacterium]
MSNQGRSVAAMVSRMNRIVLFTVLMFYGVLSFAPAAATLQTLQTGMEAPDFSLKTIADETKTFEAVKGEKLTVLVFWSTWSTKSEKILKRMQQLHERYKGQGLSIIAVNVDDQQLSTETLAEIRTVSEKLKISFPMLVDHGLVAFHDYGVIALPSTVIMDKDRMIKDELSGYPLVGSEAMVDFIISTIEGKKIAVVEGKVRYQPNKNALRFYNMGKTTLRSKRMAETAEMWFKKAIEADTAFVLPHLSLGKMYLQRGDTALARAEYKEALARAPEHPIALCELGLILINEGKAKEGAALFDAARKVEESYTPCYYYAGYAHGKEGRMEDALKLFNEAKKLNPFDYNIFVYQGKVFQAQKDREKAFDAYKKALEIILHLD